MGPYSQNNWGHSWFQCAKCPQNAASAWPWNWLSKILFGTPRGQWVKILRPWQDERHVTDYNFKRIFLNENIWISIENFTEVCSQVSNWQYASIGSDNGLAPSRRQAIIWTNDDLGYWAYMHHSASCCWMYLRKHILYLHFLAFLKTEMVQVVEIIPHGKQELFDPHSHCHAWLVFWQCTLFKMPSLIGWAHAQNDPC